MNRNTNHTPQSSTIPTGVYDLETLKAECHAVGIPPTRSNLRRMRRAIDLHQSGAVKPFYNDQSNNCYFVKSQSKHKFYCVMPHSGCDCPDAKKLSETHAPDTFAYDAAWRRINQSNDRCKHEIAVMLYKEQLADQAEYDEWLCEQYEAEQASIDDSLAHYDPSVDFPY